MGRRGGDVGVRGRAGCSEVGQDGMGPCCVGRGWVRWELLDAREEFSEWGVAECS